MAVRTVDMAGYARKDHFNYFRSLAYPYGGLTVDADVTSLVRFCKEHHFSFYLLFMHAAALAADEVPELRQRIRDGGIVEYDECPTSHIELLEDRTYCYCTLRHHMPLEEYIPYAEDARARSRQAASIEEDGDAEGLYFISTVPWLHYSAIIQPVSGGDDSNPRITWGKFAPAPDGKLMMPVSLLAHHALVDGIQFAAFYENLSRHISAITGSRDLQ